MILILFIISYVYTINFNLPFLAMDELTGNVFTFKQQLEHILIYGRSSHLFSFPTNWFLSFRAPTFIELIPRFLSIIILFISLLIFLKHLKFDKLNIVFISIFIITTHSLDWQHNGMIAFFGSYNLYIAIFFFSIVLYERNADDSKIINIIVFLLLVLTYASELFVGLAMMYVIIGIIAFRTNNEMSFKNPFISSLIFYFIVFLLTRFFVVKEHASHMINYMSGGITSFSFFDLGKGFFLYLINSLPLYNIEKIHVNISIFLSFLITISLIIFFIKILINSFKTSNRIKFNVQRLILLLIILVLIPELLMALQPMKLEWILSGASTRYVFSYYSWIAIVLFLAVMIKNSYLDKKILFVMYILMIFYMFLSVNKNIKFTNEYSTSMKNWLEIDKIFKNSVNIDEVKIPSNLLVHPYISPVSKDYIKNYGQHFYNKKVKVCSEYGNFNFTNLNLASILKLENFYNVETFGRWTKGDTARAYFSKKLLKGDVIKIVISNAFDKNRLLNISFSIGENNQNIIFSKNSELFIKIDKDIENPVLEIKIPAANSPKLLGLSNDDRMLGIAIQEINIGYIDSLNNFHENFQEFCE